MSKYGRVTIATHQCIVLKPGKDSPKCTATPVHVPSAMPCVTILVHGVNDVGEAYPAQEKGICEGLNERIGSRLQPASYSEPASRPAEVLDDPDAALYQHELKPHDEKNQSPVIPFYWGFREVPKDTKYKKEYDQYTDRSGNRLDKRGIKQGGPFANATTNIPDMWLEGFDDAFLNAGSDIYHPLMKAPPRAYMVLAAKRLALLIQIIRLQYDEDTLNIVAHSQGGPIALLAHAYLAKWGARGADCLILNNAPYSLVETGQERQLDTGLRQQTVNARFKTLKRIVEYVTKTPHPEPKLNDIKANAIEDRGQCGSHWPDQQRCPETGQHIPLNERDNRGKVYLYFSPEDATVGLKKVQGIGWQGVPDQLAMRNPAGRDEMQACLSQLGPRFLQRVFTWKPHQGQPLQAGVACRFDLCPDEASFWEHQGGYSGANRLAKLAPPPRGHVRQINGEALGKPFTPKLTHGNIAGHKLDVGPIDAAIAVTNGGIEARKETMPDPRLLKDRAYHLMEHPAGRVLNDAQKKQLEDLLNAGLAPGDQREIVEAVAKPNYLKTDGTLELIRRESPNTARRRLQTQGAQVNSYHSAIVSNPEHSRRVTAYDLAVGVGRSVDYKPFFTFLCAVADWRKGVDKADFEKTPVFTSPVFAKLSAEHQQLLRDTWHYARTGILPKLEACADLPLIVSETLRQLEPPPLPGWAGIP